MKIDNSTKRSFREIAKTLPKYYESYDQRKFIHHKDIETHKLAPEGGVNKMSSYTMRFNDGHRLIDADQHYKRMTKAFKTGGRNGYREYLLKIAKLPIERISFWDKVKMKLNMHQWQQSKKSQGK